MILEEERKKREKEIAKNLNYAKWVLVFGIFLVLIAPSIFTHISFFKTFNCTRTGQIGDTIGGITSPIVNLVGAILVFFALRAQIDANKLIQDQIYDQKNDEVERKKINYITEKVHMVTKEISEFAFSYKKENYKYNYQGSEAIYEFLNSIKRGGNHGKPYEDFIKETPKILELVALLQLVLQQLINVEEECKSELDIKYFNSILLYHYNSKILQPITSFQNNQRRLQHECMSCGQKHGIPDEIFDLHLLITNRFIKQ